MRAGRGVNPARPGAAALSSPCETGEGRTGSKAVLRLEPLRRLDRRARSGL